MRACRSRAVSWLRSSAPAAARHASNCSADLGLGVAGERVEQGQVLGRFEQRLMIVLSVQIEQCRAELSQRARRRERIVDERAASSLRRDFAPDDHFGAVRPFEHGLNNREVLAGPHQVRAGPAADEQVDGLDEHRSCPRPFRP